jgi:hypothetical protein
MILQRLKDIWQGKTILREKRDGDWPETRRLFLKSHPTCAVCGGKEKLEVHHIEPFHLVPGLELIPYNLITLCESKRLGVTCHLFFGHLGNYRKYNPNIKSDATIWNMKLRGVVE